MTALQLLDESFAPQIAAIEAVCFSEPWSEQGVRDAFAAGYRFFGAVDAAGRLVGYAGCSAVLDEGTIANVAVLSDCRRQGYARGILTLLIDDARQRGLHTITLEARASNLPAQTLYQSLGFVPLGVRRGLYAHPAEDGVMMQLTLGGLTG